MNTLDQKLDEHLDSAFDRKLDELIEAHRMMHFADDGVTNYKAVTPAAKMKLKGLLKYYAKQPKPFTACVRDNRKRFGPRAEQVCAVLKDMIRGTTKWRGKDNPNDKGTAGLSEHVEMDDETAELIERLSEMDLWDLLGLAQLEDDAEIQLDHKGYSMPERMKAAKKGKALPDGSYPINNAEDLKNAIQAVGRAKDKAKAKKHIVNRAKALGMTQLIPDGWENESKDVKLAYPIDYRAPEPEMNEADKKFLADLLAHHQMRLKMSTKYATLSDIHPDVASFATDAVSESTRQIARINRMMKTGRPY